jgi:predicted membrane metal-binding protein
MATAPFAAQHFGTVTPWGLVTNIIGIPLIGLWDYANGHDFNDWRPFRAELAGGTFNDGRSSRALSFGKLVCWFPASWVKSGTAWIYRFIRYGDRHDDIAAFDQTDGAHWPGSGGNWRGYMGG